MLLIASVLAISALWCSVDDDFSRLLPAGEEMQLTLSAVPIGNALRRRRGRPRKFAGPSRAVTLTLPEAILERLAAIDRDVSRAIVEVVKRKAPHNGRPAAELSVYGDHAVITVRPTPSLERRAGINLVPLPDGRALISFDQPRTIPELELILSDALEDRTLPDEDRQVFEGIWTILKEARRSNDVALLRRSIIVLESARPARSHRVTASRRKS